MDKNTNILILLFLCLPYLGVAQLSEIQSLIQAAQKEQQEGAAPGRVLARWLRVHDAMQKEEHTQLPEVCMSIAEIYEREQLHAQALPYFLEALSFKENNNLFDDTSIRLYNDLGQTYANLANPDSAVYFYNKIFTRHKESKNINGQINALQEMVKAYSFNGNYQKSLEYNLQLKQLLEKHQRPNEELMRVYNNLGYNYNQLSLYNEAITNFEQALTGCPKNDLLAKVTLMVNIGIAYYNLNEFNESISYLQKAKKIKSDFDANGLDEIDHLIATVYLRKKDLYNALQYSEESVDRAQTHHHDALLSDMYYTSALIHSELYEYDIALDFFQKHLQLKDSFALEEKFRQQQLLQQQIDLERTEKQIKIFMINEEVQELAIAQLKVEAENQELALKNKEAQLAAGEAEKELLQKENEIKASKLQTQELETQRAKQELELARQRLIASRQQQEVDKLQQKETLQQLELKNKEALLEKEQREKVLLISEKRLSDLEIEKQAERLQSFYYLGALSSLILLIVAGGWIYSRRLNQELNKKNRAIELQKEEITTERNKSDLLLLNILPQETAMELKEKGYAIPKRYDQATVMFTDFSGFTKVASHMSPEQLIEELNFCFQAFDAIVEKHGLEKIKTIGDAYMCVCGIPVPESDHSLRTVKAGKEIVAFMNERIAKKQAAHQEYWQMRMGIHSGPVVAGVVGKKKFAYDIWGDTVNIASRMETNGEVGKINISEATYQLVKNEFRCQARGKVDAKNLGEVNMYFVE